jgi:hypothetical protein
MVKFMILDYGGRRIQKDRRKFSFTTHLPERRVIKDRRGGKDRRKVPRILSRTDLLILLVNIFSHFALNFNVTRNRIIAGRGGIGGTGICDK